MVMNPLFMRSCHCNANVQRGVGDHEEKGGRGETRIIPPKSSTSSMQTGSGPNMIANPGMGSNSSSTPNAPMVTFTPLNVGGSAGRGSQNYNVNPAMNMQGSQNGNVQVMNMLDASQSGSSMADLALADNGFLEGLPGGMFDWSETILPLPFLLELMENILDQWDTFFSRFSGQGANIPPGFNAPQGQQQQQAQTGVSSPHNLPPRFAS